MPCVLTRNSLLPPPRPRWKDTVGRRGSRQPQLPNRVRPPNTAATVSRQGLGHRGDTSRRGRLCPPLVCAGTALAMDWPGGSAAAGDLDTGNRLSHHVKTATLVNPPAYGEPMKALGTKPNDPCPCGNSSTFANCCMITATRSKARREQTPSMQALQQAIGQGHRCWQTPFGSSFEVNRRDWARRFHRGYPNVSDDSGLKARSTEAVTCSVCSMCCALGNVSQI